MFERLVYKLILDHIGIYINNIHTDQLKVDLWRAQVELRDVELNLEVFDDLQLPFSLKEGRVGKLCVKVPWKRLGRDPIFISLENVFVRACQRDDHEWNADSVKRREYTAKKAKLSAAEISLLSKCVSDTQTGKSFIPYIMAKILDSVQVSFRDVHISITNKETDLEQFAFGLRFSSLTMERSCHGEGTQVIKIIDITELGIYCNTSEGTLDLLKDNVADCKFYSGERVATDKFDYMLEPCDVLASLEVNRSGNLVDGAPQYSVSVELTTLVLKLNESQMQKILVLLDYLGTCQLREKYGDYRPCSSTLYSKPEGWQKMWWRYAQESVLSDVRKRLQKTSWMYLGWRLCQRRKYVNLYKRKLNFISEEQLVDRETLWELEQMERESDMDDILSYRSFAERKSQETLQNTNPLSVGKFSSKARAEGQQNNSSPSSRARGWIKWLSLGILGDDGTEDSINLSGAVSDEIVKDMYAATQSQATSSLGGASLTMNGIFLFSIVVNVHQINVTLLTKLYDKEIIKITLDESNVLFKLWEKSWNLVTLLNSVKMADLCTNKVILLTKERSLEQNTSMTGRAFFTSKIDMSSVNLEPELNIEVVFEPFEVTYESDILLNLWSFYLVLKSFQSQSERVLSSINGFENTNVRLSSKAEYIFQRRTKITWDASVSSANINFPWRHEDSEFVLVFELESLTFRTRTEAECPASVSADLFSTPYNEKFTRVNIQELYDHFEILLTNFEVNVKLPDCHQAASVVERFSASLTLASCIVHEPIIKQLEVYFSVPSLCVHFSPSIYGALLGFVSCLDKPKLKSEPEGTMGSITSKFCISGDLKCVSFNTNTEDDVENSPVLLLALGEVKIRCDAREVMDCWICSKTLRISTCTPRGESSGHLLCSSRSLCTNSSVHEPRIGVGIGLLNDLGGDQNQTAGECLLFHYRAPRILATCSTNYCIWLTGLDLHIYPNLVGLLCRFFDQLSGYGRTSSVHYPKDVLIPTSEINDTIFKCSSEPRSFGFSNFCEVGSTALEGLPFEQFPFVTIHNSGSLGCLEQSLNYAIPEWRNSFVLRDGKSARRSTLCSRKSSTISDAPILKPLSCIDLCRECEDSYDSDHDINLTLREVKVYFHDSSCILGILTLPVCNSSFIVQGSECMDIMCSADGLLLSSEIATKTFSEFLWGPSEQNISPILNLRLRKNYVGALNQNFEISISVQHVYCVLPSEYLSILIGYFSLPDWSPHGYEKDGHKSDKHKDVDDCHNVFKIEILSSILLLPLECNEGQSLQLEIPETYISFTTVNHMEDVLRDIPLACIVQTEMIVDSVHLLNVFGRSLCLSLLLKDDLSNNIDEGHGHISLISELDLDLWIRIPSDSAPTCIMLKINNGQVNAEDDYFLFGVEAVLNVTNEFSRVGRDSDCFTSNFYQFLELKKTLEDTSISDNASCVSFKEVVCCVNQLSIKTYRSKVMESLSSILVAQVDTSFKLSASLRDDIPLNLDIGFCSLELHSCHSRVILVQCKADSSVSSGVGIHLDQLKRPNEILVDLPSIHMWLHLSEWCEFIELLQSFSEHLGQTSFMKASTTNSTNTEESSHLTLISENIVLSFHYPSVVKEEVKIDQDIPLEFSSDVLGESMIKGKHCQYITMIFHSRECKIVVCGSHTELTCRIEEARGTVDTLKDKIVLSRSFFQLLQVSVLLICDKQLKRHVSVDLLVDSVSMCVSHQLFLVWHCLGFNPESGSSQHSSISMDLKMQLRKASLLLTDETYICNGAVLEVLFSNSVLHSDIIGSAMEASLDSDLLVNYFNIEKVAWEPFIETWNFLLNMTKAHSAPLNASVVTDIHLKSAAQLNVNLTEHIIEVIFRLNEVFKTLWSHDEMDDLHGTQRLLGSQTTSILYKRRFAPYLFQNETSLPILLQLPSGLVIGEDDLAAPSGKGRNVVYPGSSVCIFPDEASEEQLPCLGGHQPHERLVEKKSHGMGSHMISVQLDGTSGPSMPISMDSDGLSYIEVHFPEVLQKETLDGNEGLLKPRKETEEYSKMDASGGFVVPMVFDVSTVRYRKLIRVYSTVILVNSTSIPLELWFDTPFSVSSKVQEQIYPGQKFPLPLHVAEGGLMRWRPLNSTFLWSEAHPVSKVVTRDTKLGSFRSFVCYPCHSTSDPFRCCLSVEHINLPSASGKGSGPFVHIKKTLGHSVGNNDELVCSPKTLKMPSLHIVTLTTPLLVRNYMPVEVSLTVESDGVARTVLISKDHSVAISHSDSTHDLGLVFRVHGFRPSISKFPSAEAFALVARFHDNQFSQSETMTFYPDSSNIPINVTVEKTIDALCGARKLCIFVPYLLYNCTGLPINVAQVGDETKGFTFPPCDELIEMDQHLSREHSPVLLRSKQELHASPPNIGNNIWNVSSVKQPISLPANHQSGKNTGNSWSDIRQVSSRNLKMQEIRFQTRFSADSENGSHLYAMESVTPKACMYFPRSTSSGGEHMVRLSVCMPHFLTDSKKRVMWSNPFYLVPSGASSCVIVPLVNTSAAYMLSATSIPLAGPLSGRTSAFIFQPRYVIRNACSKGLCYKQKGTKSRSHLGVGEQSHLHWADTTRKLLVSLVFDGPGWLLSGSFFPDHLGDTQIKMRNENGTSSIVRVGVQNADVIIGDEIVVESPSGTSATLLILLSDDVTGFMPYRIDNFSMETLRIYQEKCETFETTVRPYSSCPYIWDEPCYPRRLVIEVIGEGVLGAFTLDDVMENTPICLPSRSELRRQVILSIHADGDVKVLNLFDSSYLPKEMKDIDFPGIKEKRRVDSKEEMFIDYCGRISFDISSIGVSLISSYPEELLFASAKGIKIDLLQSVETLNMSFQISSLQVDNQLNNSTYPVILYLGHNLGSTSAFRKKNKDNITHISSEGSCQPVFFFSAKRLRNTEASSEYFEYIVMRLADIHLELEEEVMLCLLNFSRNVILNTQRGAISCSHPASSLHFPGKQFSSLNFPRDLENPSLPTEFPNEDFLRQIHFLARTQNKIYVELFDLSSIKLTLSFCSTPCMLRNEDRFPTGLHRVLMALADVEGATVHLKQLRITRYMGTSKSFQEIFTKHYAPQLLHKMYKIFGSASVIGNPMEFAKSLRLGVRNSLSVSRGISRSPSGLFAGMAEGTLSLCNSFIYAMSNTTTQFSKSVNKALIAFTYDHHTVDSLNKGVVNVFLEGLTGLLQSPIQGAEERGLPGFLSGAALGTARLVTRPVASILSVTGKIAQSIKKRSNPHHSPISPYRLPRHLIKGHPLQSFTEEGAIAKSVLQSEDLCLKSEKLIMCMKLKEEHKFFIITEKLILVVTCSNHDLNSPQWEIEVVVRLDDVTYVDREVEQVIIVSIDKNNNSGTTRSKPSINLGFTDFRTVTIEFAGEEEGNYVLEVLRATCKCRNERGTEVHVLHRYGVRGNNMESKGVVDNTDSIKW
ncbi:hypothetical protein ACHQM5_009620 [Ranunculus cassubicifolius]